MENTEVKPEITKAYLKAQFANLNTEFLEKLRGVIELHEKAFCRIGYSSIEIGVLDSNGKELFASGLNLCAKQSAYLGVTTENSINFGSSGSFSPKNEAPYWRTRHASSILQNWEAVCEIVNETCQKYSDICVLVDEFHSKTNA